MKQPFVCMAFNVYVFPVDIKKEKEKAVGYAA